MDHFRLGQLLLQRRIPHDIVLIVLQYLRNQKAQIVWNGEMGEYINIEKGVRQGGILSPLLFKLYIDDVLNDICNSDIGCKSGILCMNILAYADDLVILANSQSQPNQLYKILEIRMGERKLIINKNKSQSMIFKKRSSTVQEDNVTLSNDTFKVVMKYKYLGHILQYNLEDLEDIEFRLNSFYAQFNWLF